MAKITMPQLGETVIEGTILKWLKAEGETVALDEPLFEISTDKVDTEVPSPEAGVLAKILVPEGETVAVGTELAELTGVTEVAEAKAPVGETAAMPPAVPPAPPAPESTLVPAASIGGATHPAVAPPARGGPRSQILSPLVRRLAEEHGVDLSQVSGTGTGGRITKKDVLGFIEAAGGAATATAPGAAAATTATAGAGAADSTAPPSIAPAPPAPLRAVPSPTPEGSEEVIPVSHLRKAIAEHMVASVQTSARAWTAVEVNMENVVRLRERTKDDFAAREGFKLTYMPFITRAVTEGLLAFPMVNAELRGEEIVLRHYVNMGIAVSIDGGLIVPVVKGTDSMNLVGLARAINDVAVRARGKQLQPDEVHGGTFSITNPGPFGSLISVPIINQPNSAILAFDTIQKRPVVIDDAIAIRNMVYLSLSWDHRVIDGALAAQFLARVKENLETWDFAEDLGL